MFTAYPAFGPRTDGLVHGWMDGQTVKNCNDMVSINKLIMTSAPCSEVSETQTEFLNGPSDDALTDEIMDTSIAKNKSAG